MSAGQPLIVAIERTDPVVVITAAGELDAATVGRLDSAIDEVIREHEHHLVLDVGGVSFVDSTGITALISGLRRLNRSRRRLALACTTGKPVGRALALTGLDHTFECHATVQDAVDTLSGAPLIGR
ncbi:MAG: STAS domain-containing protein [Solirubrobacteraceae bacterium]